MLNLESENKWLHSKDNYVSLSDNVFFFNLVRFDFFFKKKLI